MAISIFAVGMVMVACIFPVAAAWTRHDTDQSMATMVAQNAVSIIKGEYTSADFAGVNATVVPIPNMATNLPTQQRAYAFGTTIPYPTGNPSAALYFWTALIRRTPASAQDKFDLFILVFKKRRMGEVFNGQRATPVGAGTFEPGARLFGETYIPMVAQGTLSQSQFLMGSEGIGLQSGTVFRKIPGPGNSIGETATTLPNEPLAFVPAADGDSNSPLITIYQTTIGF